MTTTSTKSALSSGPRRVENSTIAVPKGGKYLFLNIFLIKLLIEKYIIWAKFSLLAGSRPARVSPPMGVPVSATPDVAMVPASQVEVLNEQVFVELLVSYGVFSVHLLFMLVNIAVLLIFA